MFGNATLTLHKGQIKLLQAAPSPCLTQGTTLVVLEVPKPSYTARVYILTLKGGVGRREKLPGFLLTLQE